jgi:hypothetical protein
MEVRKCTSRIELRRFVTTAKPVNHKAVPLRYRKANDAVETTLHSFLTWRYVKIIASIKTCLFRKSCCRNGIHSLAKIHKQVIQAN